MYNIEVIDITVTLMTNGSIIVKVVEFIKIKSRAHMQLQCIMITLLL